jgi:hypothetical protein
MKCVFEEMTKEDKDSQVRKKQAGCKESGGQQGDTNVRHHSSRELKKHTSKRGTMICTEDVRRRREKKCSKEEISFMTVS